MTGAPISPDESDINNNDTLGHDVTGVKCRVCIAFLVDRSQAERLVVESVPHAACIVAKKPEAKFNPSVDRAVE